MPVVLTHDREDEDRYLITWEKPSSNLSYDLTTWEKPSYNLSNSLFSEAEANKFALASFDEMNLVPRAAQFLQQKVKVETLAFSVGEKAREELQHVIGK